MIVKENTNPTPTDRFEKAGYEAERKVAYYLKMAFGENPDLLILNDLRIELEDGITAQMDHLIIHQHGLVIIESKSVAGKLQVQDDGQWVRWYPQSQGKDKSIGKVWQYEKAIFDKLDTPAQRYLRHLIPGRP